MPVGARPCFRMFALFVYAAPFIQFLVFPAVFVLLDLDSYGAGSVVSVDQLKHFL